MANPPRKPRPSRKPRQTPESVDRPSSIDRMDKAVQDEITRLRFVEGRHLNEIIAHLKEMGQTPPSRTALGRHLKHQSDAMKARLEQELGMLGPAMQFANSFAEAVTARIGAADQDNKLRATRELMQAQIFRMVVTSASAPDDDPDAPRLDVKELFALSRTLQTLAQAEKTEEQRIRDAVAATRAEERLAAATAAEQVAKKVGGISADTVAQIRAAVLGEA